MTHDPPFDSEPTGSDTAPDDTHQGMSTLMKIILAVLGVGVVFAIFCCASGLVVWWAGEWTVDENPDNPEQIRAEIADVDMPDEFEADGLLALDLLVMRSRGIIYYHSTDDVRLELGENEMRVGPDAEEIGEKLGDGMPTFEDEQLVRDRTEHRQFQVRGEVVDFEFVEAEGEETGDGYRHVSGEFPARDADVTHFSVTAAEEDYDEQQVVQIIESIE